MGRPAPTTAFPVVLVHGLWMHGLAMALLALRLRRRGFAPFLYSYPSVRGGLDCNATRLVDAIARHAPGREVDLVGHSLGGLVILHALAKGGRMQVRRVVLLGSPIRDSALARRLSRLAPAKALIGASMRDWLAHPLTVAPAGVEIGLVAGFRSLGAARFVGGVPRPNDGVVAAEECVLQGARDRCLLPVCHSGMLVSGAVAHATGNFLRHGRFGPPPLTGRAESAP